MNNIAHLQVDADQTITLIQAEMAGQQEKVVANTLSDANYAINSRAGQSYVLVVPERLRLDLVDIRNAA
ncbi:hypothetical protein [Ferrimonas marina]|uniref:Uncharacterized protein n=1 Tax=Ferrimonas marina TaxID=299255 RepID=A0A1M5T5Z2_9GAMM|nr:hypothetical protein [Ferrimonas marina]SHH46144.1 hypothetical protein SAMN02745129_2014 [Ferrimonas marina]